MAKEPKIVDVEVVIEPPPARRPAMGQHTDPTGRHSIDGPPVHPLAALLLVVIDNLWTLPEFLVIDWAVTIPLCFLTVFLPSLLVQKWVKRQPLGTAVGYSVLLGFVAAVPTSLLGTPVGLALLAWTGISRLWGGSRNRAMP